MEINFLLHSCDSAFILNNIISEILNAGKKLYTFFIDFSKAFDYVVHENLWFKLLKLGIKGKMFNIIHSMYSGIKTRVFVDGKTSDAFHCRLGVRQGECLSPFLFAMYINDLESVIDGPDAGITINHVKLLLLLYADDIVIFADSAESLQNEINKLYAYCGRWKLQINLKKSFILIFKNGPAITSQNWTYGELPIPVTTKISFLGLVFTSNGKFHQTQLTLANQASKAIFSLHNKLKNFKSLPISEVFNLFDKCITPILTYGCEVWGFHSAPDVERIHLSFCKRILGVKKSTQNDFIYGLVGRVPMDLVRKLRIIRYWLKIVSGFKSKYVNVAYTAALSRVNENDTNNWAYNVKNLLSTHGYADVWNNQGVDNPEGFYDALKCRLIDIFKQNWSSRLTDSTRARFFRGVNSTHHFYCALDFITVNKHRVALTRLISSSHRLHVETGRWQRPAVPYENRLCEICNKLGDEYHMLFECVSFTQIRNRLIPRYYRIRPSMFKCIELFMSENKRIIRNLAKYVYLCFSTRNE